MSKIIGLASILLLIALFLGINITADRALAGYRLDLTEGSLYTVQPATKRIARSPDEPIRMTFYYSRDLARGIPQLESFGRRVTELLQTIEADSNGKIDLTIVNPEPFSEEEDNAVADGIQPQPITQTDSLYFGLVATNSLDGREVIPVFNPRDERFLEYKIAQLIAKLADPDKPTLGLITSLQMTGGFDPRTQQPTPEWTVLREMRATFDIETIPPTATELPADLDCLMIVHPKGLSEALVYGIDQYILAGGGAIIFVDPLAEAEPMQQQQMGMVMGQDRSSNLPALFDAWGLGYDPTQLAGDLDLAIPVRTSAQRPEAVPYIIWLNAGEAQLAPDDPVTGNLTSINLASAGVLTTTDESPAALEPVITTSDQSGLVPVASLQGGFVDPKTILNSFFTDGESRTIAARVTGTVPTAFPDGPPASMNAENPDEVGPADPDTAAASTDIPASHIAESTDAINVIVVADVDILEDGGWVRELRLGNTLLGYDILADNGALALNAAEQMAGSRDLLELRGRGSFDRPFTLIEQMQRDAEAEFLAKEQTLEEEIEQTRQRITDLQSARTETGVAALVLTEEQQAEVDALEETLIAKRKELREVQLNLRKDIEALETRLKILNTAAVPVLLCVLAMTMGGYNALRRRASRRKADRR